ncbi:unnamed protein product [Musa acuminata subsp. burmannicoides]
MAPYELQHAGEMELFPAAPPTFLAVMEGHENPENGKSYNKGKEEEGGHGIIHETEQQHKLCARGHWRPAEDAKLKELVSQYGPQNWNLIAEKLEGRSAGKSCRLRWFNQLDPRINRKAFSEEEEERLLAAHRLYGNKWAQIARLLHGRTDNAVKNHWHVIMARKQREQSNARRSRNPPARSPIFFPSQAQALPRRKEVSTSNNACSGESSISGTRDECDSTCTDLSLNSLTSRIAPSFLNRRRSPSQQPHSFDMLDGSDEKVVAAARNASYEKLGDSGGSFFSHGARPVAYHMSNALAHGQKRHGREKTRLPFIDFLGVGAT